MTKSITSITLALTLFSQASGSAIAGGAESKTKAFNQINIAGTNSTPGRTDLAKIKVSIDSRGFARSVQNEIDKGSPSEPLDELIWLNGQPESIRLGFDDKKISADNDYSRSHLLIFPLAKYAALYEKEIDRRRAFAERILLLEKLIAGSPAKNVQEIPIFPQADAAQIFHAQESCLKFKNGSGISFISSYGDDSSSLTEDSQFYCFQGLTDDRRFYVSFFAPIKSLGIPNKISIGQSIAYLAKLPRKNFTPSLEVLDKMISSLEIK